MNYIEHLTKEEKSTLCEIITGKQFKELFKHYEQEFVKIQKGFRAKSLKEQHALSIAITKIDTPFIATFVNMRVEQWLKEIKENIAKLKKEGNSQDSALATTMLKSVFVNNVELYFKLTGASLDTDACSNLCKRMENIKIKSEQAKDTKIADRIKAMEEENRRLSDQVEAAQHSIEAVKTECKKRVQEIEQDKNKLSSLLTKAQAKISELQTSPRAFENNEADYLAQFDDTDTSILPSVNTDKIVCLCGVITDDNDKKCLIRYADLNHDGRYNIFHRNKDILQNITNRKIFHKNGPSKDGFYGIWTWYAKTNINDPSKNWIQSQYNTELDAIELVTSTQATSLTQATNLDELVSILKEGINYQPHSRKVMFSIFTSRLNGLYTGILCTDKELNTVNEKTNISKTCIVVPVYEFPDADVIHLDNGLSFYKNAFAGLPSKLYHLKSPLDIVKDIVLSSISWSTYKTRDVTRAQYKTFRGFIDAIPVEDITSKIRDACRCSDPEAKEQLDEFLSIVWKYVNGDTLEDEIIRSALSANTELQEKTKDLIRQDWKKENESLLTEAQKKLDQLSADLKSAEENLGKAQESLEKTKAEDKHLSDIIADRKKLADDVEKAVAERIQKARENVADFIASMAFVGGQPVQNVGTTTHHSVKAASEFDMAVYRSFPEFEHLDELDAHHSWEDVFNTAVSELAEAGVAAQYKSGLAAFLCTAYKEKQPLLLVGPNAIDIAKAFCAAVTAHKHGELYCEGGCIRQAIEKIGADGEDIVIINNLLAGGWMNRLPEILFKKDIFYIATHPYAEDVQVEPKSLCSFILPLFTEFLVDKNATGKYYGGYFSEDFKPYLAGKGSEDFKPYLAGKGTRKELTILSKLGLSSLVRCKINSLMAAMHNIYPSTTTDDDFLFFIFPISYALMAINELVAAIADPQNGIEISANLKRDLQHVLGEN